MSARAGLLSAAMVVVAALALMVGAEQVHAQPDQLVLYSPPTTAGIVDGFRPPAHIGAPGNRGLQYAADDLIVAAAAEGVVDFAGAIGGDFYITIGHFDGLSTTYSFLHEVWVVQGQQVAGGSGIGLAGPSGLHFGARIGSHYLDPEVLLGASQAVPRLVLSPPP